MHNSVASADVAPGVPLEAVLRTEELDRRPARSPNYELENRALVSLAQALADSPGTILQTLADTILEVFAAESAGISLVTPDEKRFYWPAIAGVWKPHIGGGTPRDFGPCGDVLDRNAPLLFQHFELRYTYFMPVTPVIEECLLVPFYVAGKAVGTIWAIIHDPQARRFDREDLRMLVSLGRFASSAYWAMASLGKLEHQEQTLRDGNEALLLSSVRQHELTDQAEHAAARLAQLQKITAALSEAVEPSQVAKVVVEQGAPALGAVSASVLLLSADGLMLEMLSTTAPAPVTRPFERFALALDVPATAVMRSGQPVWIESRQQYVEKYPHLAEVIAAWGHQAAVALPIVDKGRILGVLALSFDHVWTADPEDEAYALTLARLCGQALERARSYEMEQHARVDLEARVLERTSELEAMMAQLRDLSARLEAAREEERARVSLELHDQLGGALTALKMDIAQIQRRGAAAVPPATYQPLLTAVDDLVNLTRELATKLRPGLLDDFGLAAAVEWELQEFEKRSGIRARFGSEETAAGLDQDIATAVFRIFQETLTNVARHAQASEVDVRLKQDAAMLTLRVQDNGRGIDNGALTNRKSLGLVGMRERVRLLSGEISIEGAAGQGTTVLVKIPLRAPGV
jgi:signal transduction histidine kinase